MKEGGTGRETRESEALRENYSNRVGWGEGEGERDTKRVRERDEGEEEEGRSNSLVEKEWISHRPRSFHLISADHRTWDTHTHTHTHTQ